MSGNEPISTGPPGIIRGKHVAIRPVYPQDRGFLYELALRSGRSWQWRGLPETPDGLWDSLWLGTLANQIVAALDDGQPLGLLSAYNFQPVHRYCYMSMYIAPDLVGLGWPLEAGQLFCRYLYERWAVRKIYGEMAKSQFELLEKGTSLGIEVEGHLKNHVYVDGSYEDLYIVSISPISSRPPNELALLFRESTEGRGE
jgi:RimJ/RimL family protein N-acetyltransferase